MIDRRGRLFLASLLVLAGCDASPERAGEGGANAAAAGVAAPTPAAAPSTPIPLYTSVAVAPQGPDRPLSPRTCMAEIGRVAAARRVAVCLDVSPATHPPCNATNSCAMIEDEIARSCALFADDPPMKGCGPDPRGMEAAADVVRRYYSAIEARDFATAWQQWGDEGRPGQTFAAFEKGFADTRATRVTIGVLRPGDGGAGSIYQPVPVTVDATLADGTRQRFRGSYLVRRVNGVDGATPSQLRWHLDSARLELVPAR